ncbi:MAG: response regulator [Deltaproteobacteria bacterium]|nr:response regulator [Deltaproteobacteria bacterium]
MHRLLLSQVQRHLGDDEDSLPPPLRKLLAEIEATYEQADLDREHLEHSLELTSKELITRNRELQAEVDALAKAEHALRVGEDRTRAILAALPDALLVISEDGVILEAEDFDSTLLTMPVGQARGRPLDEAVPPQVFHTLAPAVDAAARSGGAQLCELSFNRGRDRRRYEARLTIATSGDVVVLVRDQTERLHMAERLRVADRMASVGTLAAGVAHELNNPLAYVLGNLELMRQQLGATWVEPTQLKILVDETLDGARRMRTIIGDLRTFSQPHTEAVESIDPRAVMDSALKIAGTEIRHRAILAKDYTEIPAVRGEASKLGQVFLNLVINAVQALPEGEAPQHEILIRTYTDEEGQAVTEVSDTGPGIPLHLESRIFEPFVTSKPRDVGTGLGLSICHNIITSLGGRISVHRRAPRGTTFRVCLPPSGLPITRKRPTADYLPAVRDLPPAPGRRVLIIDDDALVASALCRLLAHRNVEVADSGRRGIEILRENDAFEVILCDLMMPEVSGMDVYETVLEERPELARRFVFMTGGAFTARARNFLDSVPNPRLEKPFDGKTLRQIVSHHAGEG